MRSVALIACLFLAACGGAAKAPLVASDIVITGPMPGRHMSAGYISLTNNTSDAINITHVVSPEFAAVEMHESLLEDGIARMRRIETLTIPANSSVSLQRGGKHLMLMRPTAALDTVSLGFYSGDTLLLNVEAPVSRSSH
jgi:periplasmic copper chaperone A